MNPLFQNAIARKTQNVPPIWVMRQAGRYHSHYQALRAKYSFDQLCKLPEVAAQVALGPVQEFDFDISILFSDILYPLDALGMGLEYTDKGPKLGWNLNFENLKNLKPVDEVKHYMDFQKEAMKCTRAVLPKNKSLIGFVGGPWTLFVYATEGGHAGSLTSAKRELATWRTFRNMMEEFLTYNIQIQLDGGAEVVMVLDTAAGEVSPLFFQTHIAAVLKNLAAKFPNQLGYYSKGTQKAFFNGEFLNAPWAGVGVDHRNDISEVLKWRSSGIVQGNFDQSLLFLDTDDFKKELSGFLAPLKTLTAEQRAGWVCGLGHGVLPKTPEKHVKYFVDHVREIFGK